MKDSGNPGDTLRIKDSSNPGDTLRIKDSSNPGISKIGLIMRMNRRLLL